MKSLVFLLLTITSFLTLLTLDILFREQNRSRDVTTALSNGENSATASTDAVFNSTENNIYIFNRGSILETSDRYWSPGEAGEQARPHSSIDSKFPPFGGHSLSAWSGPLPNTHYKDTEMVVRQESNGSFFKTPRSSDTESKVVNSSPTIYDTSDRETKSLKSRKYAYVTLLSTSRERKRHIGYLSGILVACHSLRSFGSSADFVLTIVMYPGVPRLPQDDQALLQRNNVMHRYIKPNWQAIDIDGVMLSKIYCWKMTSYDRVIYMDSDVFPTANMDAYFNLETTTGFAGGVSPLNGGFVVLTPSLQIFNSLQRLVVSRGPLPEGDRPPLDWDNDLGWSKKLGRQDRLDSYEKDGGKLATGSGWSFNAAWSDQGLLYYYFRFLDSQGGLDIISRRHGRGQHKKLNYQMGKLTSITPLGVDGFPEYFVHFAGRVKPWNLCSTTNEKQLLAVVKRAVRDPSKINKERGHAFWQWHSVYADLNVDLSIDQLSQMMTKSLNCR